MRLWFHPRRDVTQKATNELTDNSAAGTKGQGLGRGRRGFGGSDTWRRKEDGLGVASTRRSNIDHVL